MLRHLVLGRSYILEPILNLQDRESAKATERSVIESTSERPTPFAGFGELALRKKNTMENVVRLNEWRLH